jgi:deoxycytidylate deaminase
MSALTIPIQPIAPGKPSDGSDDSMKQFRTRESKELIVGFIGPIGCGIAKIVNETEILLVRAGYEVRRIKISDFLKSEIDAGRCVPGPYPGTGSGFRRYNQLQDVGMQLRTRFSTACLAQHAMEKIGVFRLNDAPATVDVADVVPNKVAYLIDQLKHPDEIHMLRTVYRRLFYLVGTTSYIERRKELLIESGIKADEAERLIARDRKEDEEAGQQMEKGLKLADLYIRNRVGSDHYKAALARFFELVHGRKIHTPTREEYGMYLAHAAGAKSACLSRQVGASIFSPDGEVVSTGRNDVPKAGGGLYGFDPAFDMRCFAHGGYCRNVEQKELRRQKMNRAVKTLRDNKELNLEKMTDDDLVKLTDAIYRQSGLSNLIEFSRSVHAEMDAIVASARNGSRSINGGTLFSTTFPCHSCARHIVAAGIVEVFYIEPYEKSLALELHDDAIAFDEEEPILDKADLKKPRKVRFVHFEGVSPRAYIDMFQQHSERKDETGKYTEGELDGVKKIPEYLDSYKAFEARAVENFKRQFQTSAAKAAGVDV